MMESQAEIVVDTRPVITRLDQHADRVACLAEVSCMLRMLCCAVK